MSAKRDIAAFDQRAAHYESGWLGRLHHDIVERAAAVALLAAPYPATVLDVGCGTGELLGLLADRYPQARELAGVDPAPSMVAVASMRDQRIAVQPGFAEQLPFADGAFDLVISTTSFDHWSDQAQGLAECSRVLADHDHLVIADLFSYWLIPTLVGDRRHKARTKVRLGRLLAQAHLRPTDWQPIYPLIRAVTATKT